MDQPAEGIERCSREEKRRKSFRGARERCSEGIAGERFSQGAGRARESGGSAQGVVIEIEAPLPLFPFHADRLETVETAAQFLLALGAILSGFDERLTDPTAFILKQERAVAVHRRCDAPAVGVVGPRDLAAAVAESAEPAFEVPGVIDSPTGRGATYQVTVHVVLERFVTRADKTAEIVVDRV